MYSVRILKWEPTTTLVDERYLQNLQLPTCALLATHRRDTIGLAPIEFVNSSRNV